MSMESGLCPGQPLQQEPLPGSLLAPPAASHTEQHGLPEPVFLMERPCAIHSSSWQRLLIMAEEVSRAARWPVSERPSLAPARLMLSALGGKGLPCVL